MAKHVLVKVRRVGHDGEAQEWLQRESERLSGDESIVARDGFTLEKLCDYCDLCAEGRNNHSFVTVHRLLGALLYRKYGRPLATEILQEIAGRGGLDGMNGMGYHGDEDAGGSYAELGVPEGWPEGWPEWNLPE